MNCSSESFNQYEGDDQVVTSFELRDKLLAEKRDPRININSGIPGIDTACKGFQDGELIVISGPTKNGKTLLAQTLTANFSKKKAYPGWFSYEVPARQFLDQFPALPLFYLPQKNKAQDFNWFMERCLEAHFKYNTRIFFIDHLHYLIDMARIKSTSLDIGTIVRRIKRFAVDNDFVIFLLAHIGKNESEDLSYRDLRDSSFIAQESDCVIMIKRTPQEGQNTARARIEFHRRTGIMQHVVYLEKKGGYLYELAEN
jgi:replicative DNA helicase